jgi:hypothetical protein
MSFYFPEYKRKPTNKIFKCPSTLAIFKIAIKTLSLGGKKALDQNVYSNPEKQLNLIFFSHNMPRSRPHFMYIIP